MTRKTDETRREIQVPFQGFCESIWSYMIDAQAESWVEYEETERQKEDGVPKALRLDGRILSDILFDASDYRKAYAAIAEDYAPAFIHRVGQELGFKMHPERSNMSSPREYNFQTDRLFVTITAQDVKRLYAVSRKDGHRTLCALVAERHSSRSGFWSYYSDDARADWLTKPLLEWDHNELETLLLACLQVAGGMDADEIERGIYDDWADRGYQQWELSVDWGVVSAKCEEAREVLREEMRKDGVPVPDMIDDKTLDLFNRKTQEPTR